MRNECLVGLLIAACGTPGGSETTTPDGDVDAASPLPDSAPPDRIEVTVLPDYWMDPIADLPVVFSASDGTLLGVETTDATGHASHKVTGPASVTVLKATGNQGTVTIAGVSPGTQLRFGALWTYHPTIATMHASWPSGMPGAYFELETRCGGAGGYTQQANVPIDTRCTGTFDATITQYYNDSVQYYLTLEDQTPINGAALTFTGAWKPAAQFTASFTGLPPNTRLSGSLIEAYQQERFFGAYDSMSTYSTTGNASLFYGLPPASDTELHQEVTAYLDYGVHTQVVGRRLAYTNQVGFDLAGSLVPSITDVEYDEASGAVHWTTQPGTVPKAVRVVLDYPGFDNSYPTWIIVAPGDVTSVKPPQLPESLAQFRVAGRVTGSLSLLHIAKSYADVVGDIDLWFGRSNIDRGTIDWQGAPAALTGYTMPVETF